MKLKDIFNWIRKIAKPEKQIREIDKEDPYATIKHTTKTLGFRHYARHNNRKATRGRHLQYVKIGNSTKPIYHNAL
jgi:hypothetical protein